MDEKSGINVFRCASKTPYAAGFCTSRVLRHEPKFAPSFCNSVEGASENPVMLLGTGDRTTIEAKNALRSEIDRWPGGSLITVSAKTCQSSPNAAPPASCTCA